VFSYSGLTPIYKDYMEAPAPSTQHKIRAAARADSR
jgi:hypothetical protein